MPKWFSLDLTTCFSVEDMTNGMISQTQAKRPRTKHASRDGFGGWGHDMNDMENSMMDNQDVALALFLEHNDADQLTDILVAALDDALRLLQEDVARDTLH